MSGAFLCGSETGGCGEIHPCDTEKCKERFIAPCGTYWSRKETGKWVASRLTEDGLARVVVDIAVEKHMRTKYGVTSFAICSHCKEPSSHARNHHRKVCYPCLEAGR